MLRVLIVGLGSIGQRHLRNLRAKHGSSVDILAYRVRRLPLTLSADMRVRDGVNVEDAYGVRVFTTLEEALEQRPDLAFVCNPTSLHLETAIACARAGCHLFIEKPVAHTLDGVDALIEEVERRHRVAMVGYQLRFHPCFERLADALEQHAIGNVISVRAEVGEYLPGCHKYEDYRDGYNARRSLGGGIILSHIHEMDYLCALFGPPRTVYAVGGHLSDLEMDAEDTADILLSFNVNRRAIPINIYQDFIQSPGVQRCRVIGDRGQLHVDFRSATFSICDKEGRSQPVSIPSFERNQLFVDEVDNFLAAVSGNGMPRVSLNDGVRSLRVALAAKESLATGRVMEFADETRFG